MGIKAVVFTNNKYVINFCQKLNIFTENIIYVNKYGLPILRKMVEIARIEYPSDFVIYINSDILINPNFFSAVYSISSKLGSNVYE